LKSEDWVKRPWNAEVESKASEDATEKEYQAEWSPRRIDGVLSHSQILLLKSAKKR
jgi:hypothetical protein